MLTDVSRLVVRGNLSSGAIFSVCDRYRYSLWRDWTDLLTTTRQTVVFIGLNPSTADERDEDPTIRRCIDYAKRWSATRLVMLNLFAYRATAPHEMMEQQDPVGAHNDMAIQAACQGASHIIAAWGVHGRHRGRDSMVHSMIQGMQCLRTTKDGMPGHPLYLPAGLNPQPFP
jgi:hypothetical protein